MGFHEFGKESPGEPGRDPFRSSDYRELYRFLLRHLPAQEVEDAIQEAYRRFLEVDPQISIRNPQGYVNRIAWNVVCDFRTGRNKQRVNFDSEKVEREMESPAVVAADPLGDQVGTGQELERALEQLSPKQRAVLVLDRGHGYTDDEIAEMTGLSKHTVKKYATQAIQRLRDADKGSDTA